MKVCVTGLRGIPDVMGGIETHAQYLYPALAGLEPHMEIIVLARRPYVGNARYEWQGVSVIPLWTLRDKYLETVLHTLVSVLHARFVDHADLLHIHGIGPSLFGPLARLLGLPVLVTHHGHDYQRLKWGPFARFVLRTGELLMMATANRVISVGRSGAERLRSSYPLRARIVQYLPNGAPPLPPGDGCDSLIEELGLARGGYVLAVGRLVPEKGFQDLIAAMAATASKLRLVVVGAADHCDAFSRDLRSQAAACDRITLAGRRSREEVAALYRHARLFVLPSYHEGLPIVALEALDAGLPILLSDIAPNRDLGLPDINYFPVGDRAALASRLAAPCFDELRPAAETLLAEFRWENIARQTHAVILETAGRARPLRSAPASDPGYRPNL